MLLLIGVFFIYAFYNYFYNINNIKIKNEEINKVLESPPLKGEETKTIFLPSGLSYRSYKDTTLKIFLNREITEEEYGKLSYLFNPNYTYRASFSKPNIILIDLPEPKKEDIFLNLYIYLNEKEIFSRKFIQDTEEPGKEQPGNYDYSEN